MFSFYQTTPLKSSLSILTLDYWGMNKNVTHTLRGLITWSLFGGIVWERFRKCGLVGPGLSLEATLQFQSLTLFPLFSHSSLVLAGEDMSLQLPVPVTVPSLSHHGLLPSGTVSPNKLFLL